SQRVASKTATDGSCQRVTSGSQSALFQEPKNVAQTWGHHVSILTPHVLILATSSMGPHPLFAQKRKYYGNFPSTSFSMNEAKSE
ncbi:MAG: hypothetical protein ACYTBS_23305, partial [Planctomycetota bacterium]